MIFDELWRAERRAKKESKRLEEKYHPLLEAAKKEKDQLEYQNLLSEYFFERDFNDEPEVIRTERLVKRARKLGIPVPQKPSPDSDDADEDENWILNRTSWNWYLTGKAALDLRREIRREEGENLQQKTRWVTQVIIPVVGALMALLSLLHSLRLL